MTAIKEGGTSVPPSTIKGPSRFNSKRGEWEPIHQVRHPPFGSREYPGWVCKGSCKESTSVKALPEDTAFKTCPYCNSPLVRWLKYEVKK